MKIKKLALTISILSMTHGVSVSLADQGCEAVAGPNALCEQDANGLPISGSVPVGVVVSGNLRNRMQTLLFPNTFCDPASTGHATLGNSRTCMPSLTTPELQALLTGTISSWAQVSTANGVVGDGLHVPNRASGMRLCGLDYSVQTMGQAAINWAGNCVVPTHTTLEGNSIAAVEVCMLAGCCGSKGITASIGIMPVSQTDSQDYYFIKLDGVAPTLDEHLAGNYPLVANVAGAPQFKKFYHPWGVSGGAHISPAVSGGASKDTSGVAMGCAPLRSSAIYQD